MHKQPPIFDDDFRFENMSEQIWQSRSESRPLAETTALESVDTGLSVVGRLHCEWFLVFALDGECGIVLDGDVVVHVLECETKDVAGLLAGVVEVEYLVQVGTNNVVEGLEGVGRAVFQGTDRFSDGDGHRLSGLYLLFHINW